MEDLLLGYADLLAEDRDKVDSHFANCKDCRRYFDALLELDAALIAQFSGIEPPAAFRKGIDARTSTPSTLIPPSWLPELLDFIGWASVAAVALVLLWALLPLPPTLELHPLAGNSLLVCAVLAVSAAAWLGMRVYSELKS
jgi:hypothetical protein